MDKNEIVQNVLLLGLVGACSIPLGLYIGKILSGETPFFIKPLRWIERGINLICGIKEEDEMSWKQYAIAVLLFNFIGFLFLVMCLCGQSILPLNPDHLPNVPFWLAFNTAISFVTNTNWQAYSGETTLSHFSQMIGLGVQNFLSAATGIAVLAALARGFLRKNTEKIGNFLSDLSKAIIYILLPLSLLMSVALMSQGVLQNFLPTRTIQTLEHNEQKLPMGPVASQVAIKQLGSNGGGFFGVNSAHPFENPTPISNAIELMAILLIPCSLPFTFGYMVRRAQHGFAIATAMWLLLIFGFFIALVAEVQQNPAMNHFGFWEGKEIRFGIGSSVLWEVTTSATSNGSVNAMHSSFSPIASGVAMFNMMLGEVIFGGVGSGMYGMVLFIILAVFLSGIMVGRTPEYLGKKIDVSEIRLAIIGILLPSAVILIFSAIACSTSLGLSSTLHKGPHGLSEIVYAFSSAAGNNGSAFAGLNANTNFYNILMGIAMLIGRYGVIIPVLAVAGSFSRKKNVPASSGTLPTDNALFIILLVGTIVIVGALTFLPVLCLGPVAEHLLMISGRVF